MKVAVITIIDQVNIGNRLQNFAVQEIMKEYGCDVSTLVYETYDEEGSKLYQIKAFLRNLLIKSDIFTSRFYLRHIKKSNRMLLVEEFNREYVNLTKKYYFKTARMTKYRDAFDYYCVGSDQVWNPGRVQTKDFYFMKFAPSRRTFSFAASMGTHSISERYLENFRSGFEHVGHISVRENDAQKLIKTMTGRDTTVLLDPTLLMDRSKWWAMARRPNIDLPERYIVTYFLSELTPEQGEFIQSYAEKQGMMVIDINQSNYEKVGPLEFVYMIANSEFVFTDSFHGTAFSLIFEKDFLVFQRNKMYDMSSRITTILEKVQLEDRFYRGDNHKIDECLNERIEEIKKQDITHIKHIFEEEKRKANDFLEEVFSGKDMS